MHSGWEWLAFGYLAAVSVVLSVIDIREHRLPNRLVLPGYLVAAIFFTLACLFGQPWASLLRATLAAVALFVFYAIFRIIDRRLIGGGDVKLAGVIGAYLGWIGWDALIVGASAAFLVGGLWVGVLLALRRAKRTTRIAFGPFMLVGAWIGIALGVT